MDSYIRKMSLCDRHSLLAPFKFSWYNSSNDTGVV